MLASPIHKNFGRKNIIIDDSPLSLSLDRAFVIFVVYRLSPRVYRAACAFSTILYSLLSLAHTHLTLFLCYYYYMIVPRNRRTVIAIPKTIHKFIERKFYNEPSQFFIFTVQKPYFVHVHACYSPSRNSKSYFFSKNVKKKKLKKPSTEIVPKADF